jgi:hypothetical protein
VFPVGDADRTATSEAPAHGRFSQRRGVIGVSFLHIGVGLIDQLHTCVRLFLVCLFALDINVVVASKTVLIRCVDRLADRTMVMRNMYILKVCSLYGS